MQWEFPTVHGGFRQGAGGRVRKNGTGGTGLHDLQGLQVTGATQQNLERFTRFIGQDLGMGAQGSADG